MSPQLTVYYNTICPVCNAGIDWQRNRLVQAARAGIIEFRDINLEPDALVALRRRVGRCAPPPAWARRRWPSHVGADCAIAIWRLTPGDAWLGRLVGLPHPAVARFVYDRFADLLYAWNRRKGHW